MARLSDSFVTTPELKAAIDRTAEQMERTRSWVIREALGIGLPLVAQRYADDLLASIGVGVAEAPAQQAVEAEAKETE
jgi:predicted transcriptional regulator